MIENTWDRWILPAAFVLSLSGLAGATPALAGPEDPQDGGRWGPVTGWPMIPVSAANLPDGRILAWASNERTSFPAGPEYTYTAIWDPQNGEFVEIPHPSHDMFCSHHVMTEDGKVFVSGGRNQGNSPWTSTFNPETRQWEVLPNMNRGRWYPTSVAMPDGRVVTVIGSGGGNTGEVWDGDSRWELLGGVNFDGPILDYDGHGESNWWPLLTLAPDGRIFHGGPTPAWHMIDPSGIGSIARTNTHNDWYPKHGTTVMYAEGKLLTAGGWVSGGNLTSSARALTVDLNGPSPQMLEVAPMSFARKFHNGVTLPNGEVLVIGGNTSGEKFSDAGSIYPVEIWNPETQAWRVGASASVPRNYHSVALLMLDGRVFSGGGGLCNCAADHQDGQIYSPPYLFNTDGTQAARPVITRVAGVAEVADVLGVSATPGVTRFSLVKMSSTTHAVNTDLRYLAVPHIEVSPGEYELTLHGNPNVLTPGNWMLFALNAQGTPSVAKVVRVSTQGPVTGPATIKQMGDMTHGVGQAVNLHVVAGDPDGDALTFSAAGLPPGLFINPASGVISGTPTSAGAHTVTLNVTDDDGGAETTFTWNVYDASSQPGLVYEYYEGNWDLLPDFDSLTPVATGVVSNFTLAPRQQEDYFGFRYTGRIVIEAAGAYTFYTNSDDGSQLFINDQLVVDNDGLHGPREVSGSVSLPAGVHEIVATFFEKGGGAVMSVSYEGPGVTRQLVPDTALRTPAGDTDIEARYVKLTAMSEVNGNPWASAAEIRVLDAAGVPLARSGWNASASSAETVGEDGRAVNVLDGDPMTIWHTEWAANAGDDNDPAHPHDLVIDMAGLHAVSGLSYLPRAGAGNGTIADYAVYLSTDGVSWGAPAASGTWAADGGEKVATFAPAAPPPPNTPPEITSPGPQSSTTAQTVALGISASDADGDALFYAGTGLPPGLSINPATGVVAGTPTTPGTFSVSITVDDGTDSATTGFSWSVDQANRPPALVDTANQTGTVGESVSLLLMATDPDGDAVTFGAIGLPDGLAVDAASGEISGTLAASGVFTVDVTVSDGSLTVADAFSWNVAMQNVAPVLTNPGSQSGVANDVAGLQMQASDANGDPLTYAASGLPPGLGVDPATGHIAGTLSAAGDYSVTVTVDDGDLSDAVTFSWQVNEAIVPITVEPLAAPPLQVGVARTYTAQASGTGPLTYSWSFGDGATATEFAESPSATHTYSVPGRYLVTVTVRNDHEQRSRTFTQAVHGVLTPVQPNHDSTIVWSEGEVWNVNPDNDTVTVIDGSTLARLAEIPVGDQPSSLADSGAGEVWVVNKAAATISRVSASSRTVAGSIELPPGSKPHGVVFDPSGSHAYVALQATGQVARLDAAGNVADVFDLGGKLRHLSVSGDGSTLYVSRFVTPPLPDEHTATPSLVSNGEPAGGNVLVVNALTGMVSNTIVLEHSNAGVSEHSGPGLPNYLRTPVMAPDGTSAWLPSKQDNILAGTLRSTSPLDHDHTVRAISSRIDLVAQTSNVLDRIDHDNASVASAAAFGRYGSYLFVTLEGNRMVAAVDAYRGEELFRFPTGRAPAGLVMAPDGRTLFVHNFMDRTVSVHDVGVLIDTGANGQSPLGTVSTVATEALSADVLLGKQHFYDALDPRLALESYMSCASCHSDGEDDGRTWDFTQFGEGLRNTSTLMGQGGTDRGVVHWTGNFDEIQDFEGQIRSFAGGLGLMDDDDFGAGTRSEPLGLPKAGLSEDLDALAAYVNSLTEVGESPYREEGGSLTAAAERGRDLFAALDCGSCHAGSDLTDSALDVRHDVGTATAASGQRLGAPLDGFDTPMLRGLWGTAPYLHNGEAPTLADAVLAHTEAFGAEADDLAAYLRQLDDLETPPIDPGCVECLDFEVVTTASYGSQDVDGVHSVAGDGAALLLQENTWRRTATTFDVTPATWLVFDFESTDEGEIHGIGLDADDNLSEGLIFKLHGTQAWGIRDFDNYAGGVQSYAIPVGQYYTGTNLHLVFANDDDAGSGNDSRFSNVRVVTDAYNMPPALAALDDQVGFQGTPLTVSLQATDPNQDTLTFTADGLPAGLTLAPDGVISGTPTSTGTWTVTVTVQDDEGSQDTGAFEWLIFEEGACSGCINFHVVSTVSFDNQDANGSITVLDDGFGVRLEDNTWRRTVQRFTITPNTVVEFDFSSDAQGEVQGIGFDENNSLSSNRVFKLHGTQRYGIRDYDNYSGGTQRYVIPVGQYFQGEMFLLLVNDQDSWWRGDADATISNLRIYEQ